jgi:hypothetical protein
MGFKDQIKLLGDRVEKLKDSLHTESHKECIYNAFYTSVRL